MQSSTNEPAADNNIGEQPPPASPSGSGASSAATEPYSSNPLLPAVCTDSPIDAARLYKIHEPSKPSMTQGAAGVLCLRSADDGRILCEYPLYDGLNSIRCGSTVAADGQSRGKQQQEPNNVVDLPLVEDISVAIEIDDGLHVLCDRGSAAGVFLGHRRARVRRGVAYAVADGKLVWLGSTPFWYRILGNQSASRSPSPPWRNTGSPAARADQASLLSATINAAGPSNMVRPSALGREAAAPPNYAASPENMAAGRSAINGAAGGPQPTLPKAAPLRRELPAPAIQPSPARFANSLSHVSPDAVSFLGSQGGVFGLSPMLVNSPKYDSDDSIPVDTEPMSSRSSIADSEAVGANAAPILPLSYDMPSPAMQPSSLAQASRGAGAITTSSPRIQLPPSSSPANSGPQLSALRVEESPRIQAAQLATSEDDRVSAIASASVPTSPAHMSDNSGALGAPSSPIPESRLPTAPASQHPPSATSDTSEHHRVSANVPPEDPVSSQRSQKHEDATHSLLVSEVVATQPVSPGRIPPSDANISRSTSASFNNVGNNRPGIARQPSTTMQATGTQATRQRPAAGDAPVPTYLPEPSALVYAPNQVILTNDPPACNYNIPAGQRGTLPRYPYDAEVMQSFLLSATQATAPTQGNFPDEFVQGTAETAMSSDFSQAFLSPLPPAQLSSQQSHASAGTSISSDGGLLISGIPEEHAQYSQRAAAAAAPRRRLARSKGNRHSIDNYTDDSDDDSDGGDAAAIVEGTSLSKDASLKPSTQSASKSGSPTIASYSQQRLNGPTLPPSATLASSRQRHLRQTPLTLLSSAQAAGAHLPPTLPLPPPPLFRPEQPRTPLPRSQFLGTILTRANQATPSSSLHRYPRSATDADPVPLSRMANGTRADFPDDLPLLFGGTQSHRRLAQEHLPHTKSSGSHKHELSADVTESPMSTPTKTRIKAASANGVLVGHARRVSSGVFASDDRAVDQQRASQKPEASGSPANSSPVLPQPSLLLLSRSADASDAGSKEPQSHQQKTASAPLGANMAKGSPKAEGSGVCSDNSKGVAPAAEGSGTSSGGAKTTPTTDSYTDALFNPNVDPLSSPPTSSPSDAAAAVVEPPVPPATQSTQLDEVLKPPPRIHLRLDTKRAENPNLEPAPKAVAKSDTNGEDWINMDERRSGTPCITPTKATRATKRGGGLKRSSVARRKANTANALPGDATSDSSPAATRSQSLRESLRKLPGNRGPSRAGLSSRRTPARKRRPAQSAGGELADGDSPSLKARSAPSQKTAAPPPVSKGKGSAEIERVMYRRSDTASGRSASERESGASEAVGTSGKRQKLHSERHSHRYLDFNTISQVERREPTSPLTRAGTPLLAARRQGIKYVTVTGFEGEEKDRLVRQLELNGMCVTENPLLADICVRQGKLGRTLKVLCALSRGVPVVSQSWVTELSSMIKAKADDSALLDLAYSCLLVDRTTERDWGISLAETLASARDNGGQLMSLFCVYIADDVARPDPVCLAVMIRSAGGHILNDFGRREDLLLQGESSTQWILHVSRRSSAAAAAELPASEHLVPIDLAADKALIGELLESSSEPDHESDEDWSVENDRAKRRSSGGGKDSKAKTGGRRARRRVSAKIDKQEDSDAGRSNGNSGHHELAAEPSLILAPPPPLPLSMAPHALSAQRPQPLPHFPLHQKSGSLSASDSSPTSGRPQQQQTTKRKRVQESPSMATTAMREFNEPDQNMVFFDPKWKKSDMLDSLAARKADLGISPEARLLVISADTKPASVKRWQKHGAAVVDPELVIQSIIHAALQF